jgi:hypothetical protein
MKLPHLFEFMDQPWLPQSLALTLREILSCGNSQPFRPYYGWVADKAVRLVEQRGLSNVVELGAGAAPITRVLAGKPEMQGISLIVSDGRPDELAYQELASAYPKNVKPLLEPVDFSQPRDWPPATLLVLSGTFHHLSDVARTSVLRDLASSPSSVMIVEPLRKSTLSMAFVFLSIVPAILLPISYMHRPGRMRRFLWCWLMPVAPLMFWWDGLVSCLRMWTASEWRDRLAGCSRPGRTPEITQTLFSQMVIL